MTLQNIVRYWEEPLAGLFAGLGVPIYFNNQFRDDHDADDEYVVMRLNFMELTEAAICEPPEHIRGMMVAEVYVPKNRGAARAYELTGEIFRVWCEPNMPVSPGGDPILEETGDWLLEEDGMTAILEELSPTMPNPDYGVKGYTYAISGPTFGGSREQPFYWGRISTSFRARYTEMGSVAP